MPLSSKEAAEHLLNAERTARRSAQAFGYSTSAPHLILWGFVWLIGYTACDFYPDLADEIWLGLLIAAWLVTIILCGYCRSGFDRPRVVRALGLIAAIAALIWSVFFVFHPITPAQAAVFPALLVGVIYFGLGFWIGARMIVTGAVIFGLALGGFVFMHQHVSLLMAALGGGALILGGLWLRKV
jgi:hypothetical protein